MGYHYDATTGRLNRITGPGLPAYGAVYTPAGSTDMIEWLEYKSDANTTLASAQRHYESQRNLVDFVENRTAAAPADPVSRDSRDSHLFLRRGKVDLCLVSQESSSPGFPIT